MFLIMSIFHKNLLILIELRTLIYTVKDLIVNVLMFINMLSRPSVNNLVMRTANSLSKKVLKKINCKSEKIQVYYIMKNLPNSPIFYNLIFNKDFVKVTI